MSIEHIIAGNIHVATSERQVCRIVRGKFKKAFAKDPKGRADRKKIYRAVIKAHRANRQLVKDFRL